METGEEAIPRNLHELHEAFRDTKHSINNSIAVVMALAELSQRNPQHFEKLAAMVLSRGPDIVSQLQEFQKKIAAMAGEESPKPR
jgi:two-component sensor histidine kinase